MNTTELLMRDCRKTLEELSTLSRDNDNFYESIDTFMDIEYVVTCSLDVRSIKFVTSLGGPNIYVETDGVTMRVFGTWGDDKYECSSQDESDLFDELLEHFPNT